MFTGIVETIGTIEYVREGSKSAVLSVAAPDIMDDVKIGDSIAVNGVCLTATTVSKRGFTADVMPETLRRSNLGMLKKGSPVNLERALPANGRFGGHIVSGHIDGTGRISFFKREDNAIWVTVDTEPHLLKYIVEKGSIAIDGVSLTVAYVDSKCFKVSLIPHTSDVTIITKKKVGDTVNLENDIVGKYVEKLLGYDLSRDVNNRTRENSFDKTHDRNSDLTMNTLFENGFL